jgi:putative two-component system response regulator
MKALIVDDNEMTLGIVRLVLRKIPGLECTAMAQPRAALGAALSGNFDVVILDYAMPDLDGAAFAKAMRGHPSTKETPIIMITGHGRDMVLDAARPAGVSEVMTKPLDMIGLRQAIQDALGPRAAASTKATPSLPQAAAV